MSSAEFQLRGVDDARLALHAAGHQPAWLWSPDGTRVLWANPVGARLLGAPHAAALFARTFGAADPHRRQVAQLAGRLPADGAVRLERLRGFGAPLGGLMTCACSRLGFADGGAGILLVAAEPVGRSMPLVDRLKNLVEGVTAPVAAFARDGLCVGASDAARALLGFRNLSDAGLDDAREGALKDGRAETPIGIGHMVLQRVGSGADIGLVALIAPYADAPPPGTAQAAEAATSAPGPEAVARDVATVDPALTPAALFEHAAEIDRAIAEEAAAGTRDAAMTEEAAPPPPPAPEPRTTPLRFVWQIDQGGFATGCDEFIALIGPQIAAMLQHPWSDVVFALGLDPDGRLKDAMATRAAWTGVTLLWPATGGGRLPIEMSGVPLFDRAGTFIGYRGFGICRDIDAMAQLMMDRQRGAEDLPGPLSADIAQAGPVGDSLDDPVNMIAAPAAMPASPTETDPQVQSSENVVPIRAGELSPALTPVENTAFNELARQLSARLEAETELVGSDVAPGKTSSATTQTPPPRDAAALIRPAAWLATPAKTARGEMQRDRMLLDLMPVGVLVYRLDRLLYANPAFLAQTGYPTLNALEDDGGIDALYVEPGVAGDSSASDSGTAVTISGARSGSEPSSGRADARLFAITWDDAAAHALIFTAPPSRSDAAQPVETRPHTQAADTPAVSGQVDAEDLAAILDTTAEGVIMFDADGSINSCNRSAEALFGYDGETLTQRSVTDLFANESRKVVQDYIDSIRDARGPSLLDHGREALGQVRAGGLIPLSITMGRTRADGPNFFAVFRDLSQAKKTESELLNARRQADRAASAKADVLARISHEVRTPLNAIIGFSEVMLDQRFGPLGSERYGEYMKDIRASGERVIAIINDLLDLSRIESGKLDLAFTAQSLNEMVEQCVAVMQPQANRSRIIIRTSLAHLLPTIVADARALRQITLNLIGNSIHLAKAGGQVIVSTALTDFGEVVLRVRDTGHGLNDSELAAAMEPYRPVAPMEQSENAGVSLSLTRALVEANRARFAIKAGPSTGTLIEVTFSNAPVKA